MTDVPPNGRPDGDDASGEGSGAPAYPPPPPGPPPAFDDDALAAALEGEIAPYTQPIPVVSPAAPAAPAAAPPVTPPAPYVEPEPEYEQPDVPEYVVPPAPPTPDYTVPPAPEAPAYEPPAASQPYDLPAETSAAASGPSTLDAIGRLEEELRRREQGLPSLADEETLIGPPPPAAAPADPVWEPALDHPEPGHIFPSPYQPFTDPVTITPAADAPADPFAAADPFTADPFPAPEPVAPEPVAPEPVAPAEPVQPVPPLDPFPPADPLPPAAANSDWLSAPPPSFEQPPPPLVEPPPLGDPPVFGEAPAAPQTPPPTEGAFYVEPAVLPPLNREVRLEDVQGLPPPVGVPAANLPAYDPNAPIAPLDPFAVPPVSPAEFGGPYATPVDAPPPGFPSPPGEENDDAVDAVDRIFGADALPVTAPNNDDLFAPPSQPIATQRLREGDPGLVGEKPQNHPVFMVETAGVEPTALDLRAGRSGRLFWLWFAANSSILSVAIGAVLFTVGMSLRQAIVATLAGVALSFLPLGLGTLAGKWSGQPTMVVSRATFGHLGNLLPAIVAILVRVFWGGVLLWLLSISAARLIVFAGIDAGMGEAVWTYLFLGVGFVLATVIAIFGYGFVALVQLITSILSGLLIAGVIVLTYPRLNIDAALATGDGPWVLVLGGAVIVFSFVGLAWVQASSDVARYQRPGSSGAAAMLWATVGATLPPFILIAWGAMLAASDPNLATGLAASPLPTIARLLPLWYPAPLLAAAGLGLISGIVMTIYSGGFALQSAGLRLPRFAGAIIAAVLVGGIATGLVFLVADADAIVRDLATTLAVPVAAWAGIFAAEMMIRTRPFDSEGLLTPGGVYPRVRVVNFLAFLLLTAVGFGLSSATFPGLTWQGFLWPLIGIAPDDPLATSDVGVLVALVLGIIVPLATAIPAIRRQEMDSLKRTPTGSIPRITGSIPRQTGSVPRQTASTPSLDLPPPRLEP
jgi:purine-cytosine permease-like protein